MLRFNLSFALLSVLTATQAAAVDCGANRVAESFCKDVDLAVRCLQGDSSCDDVATVGATVSRSLYYVGRCDLAAMMLHESGEISGEVRIKLDELIDNLTDWNVTSVDANWLAAATEANHIVYGTKQRLQALD